MNFLELVTQYKKRLDFKINEEVLFDISDDAFVNELAAACPKTFGSLKKFIDDAYDNIWGIYYIDDKKVKIKRDDNVDITLSDKRELYRLGLITQEIRDNDRIIPLLYSFKVVQLDGTYTPLSTDDQKIIANQLQKLQKDLPSFLFIPIDNQEILPADLKANVYFQNNMGIEGPHKDSDGYINKNLLAEEKYIICNVNLRAQQALEKKNGVSKVEFLVGLLQHEMCHILGLNHPFQKLKHFLMSKPYKEMDIETEHLGDLLENLAGIVLETQHQEKLLSELLVLHSIYAHRLFYNLNYGVYNNNQNKRTFPTAQTLTPLTKAVFDSMYGKSKLPETKLAIYSFHQTKDKRSFPVKESITPFTTSLQNIKESLSYASKNQDMQAYSQERERLQRLEHIATHMKVAAADIQHVTITGDMSGATIQPRFESEYVVFDFGDFADNVYDMYRNKETVKAVGKLELQANLQPNGYIYYSDGFTEHNHMTGTASKYMTPIGNDFKRISAIILSQVVEDIDILSPLYADIDIIITPYYNPTQQKPEAGNHEEMIRLSDRIGLYYGSNNQVFMCENAPPIGLSLVKDAGVIIDFTACYNFKNNIKIFFRKEANFLYFVNPSEQKGAFEVLAAVVCQQGINNNSVSLRFTPGAAPQKLQPSLLQKHDGKYASLADYGF